MLCFLLWNRARVKGYGTGNGGFRAMPVADDWNRSTLISAVLVWPMVAKGSGRKVEEVFPEACMFYVSFIRPAIKYGNA
jgi:hypothetical protein